MNKQFWQKALIRAVRTICQTAIATIGTSALITDVDWAVVVSASALAGILSILTSIATGLPEVDMANELTTDEVAQAHEVYIGDMDEEAK